MTTKAKKPSAERIYVRGKLGPNQVRKAPNREDATLLALQLACPKRLEPGEHKAFEDVHEIQNLTAITVETKSFSSLIIVGTNNLKANLASVLKPLTTQLEVIIKSANTKLYFIEMFPLVDPANLEMDFIMKMSDSCFMQETPMGQIFFGYFRLEKVSDEERFANRSVETMDEGEVAETDVYLFFNKNNRYIKILKKGETMAKERLDRLQSRGVTDLFVTADQGVELQRRRVHHILLELLEDYATSLNAV